MNAPIRPTGIDAAARARYGSAMSLKPAVLALRKHGRVLGTRTLGIELAAELREAVTATDGPILVDFNAIQVASSPVLDEISCALRSALLDHPGRIVVLTNLNEDVTETLQLVLEHRDMSLTILDEKGLKLIGGRRHLDETLAGAQELGTFTAAQLAERLAVKLPNLHHRLNQLQAAGAVARVDSAGGGRTLVFAAPSAEELVGA